ncbi:Spy/CpxP family protein refolding chaperone [Undibacterium squillarum]|uniref:Spy/CpxP family protein refolding chaperone n=1 Tax=Undibacterium squillarum TaxID=1131567 RepID=UPI0035B074EC
MKRHQQWIISGLLAAVCSSAAWAQTPPPPPPAEPGHPHHPAGHMDMEKWQEKARERMAKRQAELHDQLKITAAQEGVWKAFIQSMEPKMPPKPRDPQEMDKLNAVERMEKNLDSMREHQAQMQTRLTAMKNLYAALNPEQQKIFDEQHKRIKKEMQDRMAKQMMRRDPPAPDRP